MTRLTDKGVSSLNLYHAHCQKFHLSKTSSRSGIEPPQSFYVWLSWKSLCSSDIYFAFVPLVLLVLLLLCRKCFLSNLFCLLFFFNFEYRSTQDSSMKIASFRFFSGFTKPYKVVLYSVKVKQSFSFNWRKGVMFSLTFDPLNILCLESSIFFKLKVSYKHWSWGMLFQMVFLEILQGSG